MADEPKIGLLLGGLDDEPAPESEPAPDDDGLDEALDATVQAIADGDLAQAKEALRAAITQALLAQ